VRSLHVLFCLLPFAAVAQTTCPARTVNLKPTSTTHIDLVRQPDASYTAFEVPDSPPYSVLKTTPHFVELQFAACLPPATSPPAPAPLANPMGVASQLQVAALLASGNYLMARISDDQLTVFTDVFDAQHTLLSEQPFTAGVELIPGMISNDKFESLALSDLNQDGKIDLLAVFEVPLCLCSYQWGGVWTFLGNGDGTFQPGVQQNLTSRGQLVPTLSIALGDLSGDTKLDLALAAPYIAPVIVAPGNGDGTFSSQTSRFPLITGQSIAFADLTGRGKLDLVSASPDDGLDMASVDVAFGDGKGGLQTPTTYPTRVDFNAAALVAAADLNGDGLPDIVTAGGSVLLNDGKGGFASRHGYSVPLATGSVMLADLNGDGHVDILFGNGNPLFLSGTTGAPTLTVLFGNGTGTFADAPPGALTVVSGASFLAGSFAPNSIAAAFGNNILVGPPASAAPPLPTQLSGISVNVEDSLGFNRSAPLYFVSANQVNFLVPVGTAAGTAVVTLVGAAQPLSAIIQIGFWPELFTVGPNLAAAYAVRVAPDGTQTVLPLYDGQRLGVAPIPLDLSQPGQVYLILFGTGFDTVAQGTTTATIAGVAAPVTYAGPQPSYPGLDQINILLPATLVGAGQAKIAVSMGTEALNTAFLTIR
jgi:uncharacterized protein (TIGR03437 family)